MYSSLFSYLSDVVCLITETKRVGAHLHETGREYRLTPLCSQRVIDFHYVHEQTCCLGPMRGTGLLSKTSTSKVTP